MRFGLILLLAAAWETSGVSQTVYQVPADSKGNQIALTIANGSDITDARFVRVTVEKSPIGVTFASPGQSVKSIPAGKESEVAFTVDVGREARLNRKDTIEFAIRDAMGLLGRKSILLSFAGPTVYRMDQNFPNPFNPSTTIFFQVPVDSRVSIIVYDVLGREVRRLVDEERQSGYHSVRFDANQIASGPYFCRMFAEPVKGGKGYTSVKKLMVLK